MKLITAIILITFLISPLQNKEAVAQEYEIETLAQGLEFPWSLDFLPDGSALITEQAGRLRHFDEGRLSEPIDGVPAVYYAGQGGLMDVVVDSDFTNNKTVYLSYSHGKSDANATRLVSARLSGKELEDVKVLFTATPAKKRAYHYGGRILETIDGYLMLTVGDGSRYRDHAQRVDSHLGKIIRINKDGSVPLDNPWVSQNDALHEIWSMGHRNPQAIVQGKNGDIYAHEHGPKGGDEINSILPGRNYGWPILTRGIEYNGSTISNLESAPGMELPLVDWTPSIAPGGMTYYLGDQFINWSGDLIVVSLKENKVRRIDLDNGRVLSDTEIISQLRVGMRDIRTGPDGSLYILTDEEDGKLLRVSKKG